MVIVNRGELPGFGKNKSLPERGKAAFRVKLDAPGLFRNSGDCYFEIAFLIDRCILFRSHCDELCCCFLTLENAHEMFNSVGVCRVSAALHIIINAPIVERRKIEIADVFYAVGIAIYELTSGEIDSGLQGIARPCRRPHSPCI